MKTRSIKRSMIAFIATVTVLTAFSMLSNLIQQRAQDADQRYQQILSLEKNLATLIVKERRALENLLLAQDLERRYDSLKKDAGRLGMIPEISFINARGRLFEALFSAQRKRNYELSTVGGILPGLIDSVRYIDAHHVAYLKNLMRRGQSTQDWDLTDSFKRDPAVSAPELDIIKAAATIQNRLLDVFVLFHKMQQGASPRRLSDEFELKILKFNTSVNMFEDYSLDAQDGLLVEELLINGGRFKAAFTSLLAQEDAIATLNQSLNANAARITERLDIERQQIDAARQGLARIRTVLSSFAWVASGLLIVALFGYGHRLVTALRRIVDETGKIQRDLNSAIPVKPDDDHEFQVVFKALNTMARTIGEQVGAVEKARSELSRRVSERTSELETANHRLEKEIEERVQAEKTRKELETRLNRAQKMEALGTLAGGVAHDLNNILSGIVSYPDLILADMPTDHPMHSMLTTVKNSGERAAAIVQDLLTLARRGVTVNKVVDLRQIVAIYLASPEYAQLCERHPGVRLSTRMQKQTAYIRGSQVHLEKTLMNLVVNAFEATPPGGTVSLVTENQYIDTTMKGYDVVREGEYVKLTVSDTGAGIDPEALEHIFEPFFTRKQMGRSGSGLGMAVVWGTVKDHGGYIDVSSREGGGTAVNLYFPLTRDLPEALQESVSLPSIAGRGESILVVDDVPEQREIAVTMLARLGYRATAVSSGEAAVDYLRDQAVDLVVLDMIMLPGMDGLDTYRALRTLQPGIKAVICSGFSENHRVRAAQMLGAGAYLRKPYSLEGFGVAIRDELQAPVRCDAHPV